MVSKNPSESDKQPAFTLGGRDIAAGSRETVDLPVSVLSDHTPVTLSVHVVHGKLPGPTLFVSAAVHGDEVIGVEIVRRLLKSPSLKKISGTLLAVPIVNAFGFLNHSRYLPDRRDLNRSFPGSPSGSMASRLANLFMEQVVTKSDVGIDLHSAAIHRTNFPQIRISSDDPRAKKLANVFAAPITLESQLRPGSLRGASEEKNVPVLLYEAGESLRFDELSARSGLSGILRIMRHLDMLSATRKPEPKLTTLHSSSSRWLRAPGGGLLRGHRTIGDRVKEGDLLGTISDPFGESEIPLHATFDGLVIGRTNLPIVYEGDGLFHVASIENNVNVARKLDQTTSLVAEGVALDEDEII